MEQQVSDIPHAWARGAIARVHALQGFCTFCFHNLHRLPFSFLSFLIKIKELSAKKIGDFMWNLRHLLNYLQEFFKTLPVFFYIFLAFLSFFLASRLENLNICYKIEITHLQQAIYSRFCEGCESKKCKLQGARAHARARAYNYRFINSGFLPSMQHEVIL